MFTVELSTCMDNTTRSMTEHGVGDTIFLTQMAFLVFAILDVVDVHAVITFRSEKHASLIIKTK